MARAQCDGALLDDKDSKGAGVGAVATSVVVHARGWHFTQTPPGWRPDLRERFVDEFMLPKDTQRIDAPTPYVWIIGRTKTDGPADYEAVHRDPGGPQGDLAIGMGNILPRAGGR